MRCGLKIKVSSSIQGETGEDLLGSILNPTEDFTVIVTLLRRNGIIWSILQVNTNSRNFEGIFYP